PDRVWVDEGGILTRRVGSLPEALERRRKGRVTSRIGRSQNSIGLVFGRPASALRNERSPHQEGSLGASALRRPQADACAADALQRIPRELFSRRPLDRLRLR